MTAACPALPVPTGWQPRLPGFQAAITGDGRIDIAIGGDLDITTEEGLAGQLAALADELAGLAGTRPTRLVMDVAAVSFLDCASARLLASTAALLPDGPPPVVVSARPEVRRVLELTGLAEIIEVAD